jgi:hypothetical protein
VSIHGGVSPRARRSRAAARHRSTSPVRVFVEAVLLGVALAVVVALAWVYLTPSVYAEVTESGLSISPNEARRQFGIEVWFALFSALAGLIVGFVTLRRHRSEPVTAQIALAASGLGCAALAWQIGHFLGPADPEQAAEGAAVGTLVELPMDLTALGILLIWPLAAVVAGITTVSLMVDDLPDE